MTRLTGLTGATAVIGERERLLDAVDGLVAHVATQGLLEQTSSLLESSITLQQFRVLLQVYACGPVPIHHVADRLGFRPNVATGVVQRLVQRGLLERYEDSHDRRARLLAVTGSGRALIEELSAVAEAQRRRLFERLSDDQLRQLRDIVADLTP